MERVITRPADISKRLIIIGVIIGATVLAYFGVSSELWRLGIGTSDRYLDAPWQTRVSDHFVFHYFARTAADYHIDAIATDEEEAYATVSAALGTTPTVLIDCYLYPSVSELYRWTRMSRQFAQGAMIHLVYERFGTSDMHEVTHVIARAVGRPSRFLQEGLAVSMEQDVGGEPLPEWIDDMASWEIGAEFLGDEYEQFNRRLDARSYAIAGAFVTYLRDTYGREKLLQLYAADSYNVNRPRFERTLAAVYGVEFAGLTRDFGDWLSQTSQSEAK